MNSELKVIENDLVPIYETSIGEKVVFGAELHNALDSKQKATDWIKNRLIDCDAAEDKDFFINLGKSTGGRPSNEYIIKLDIAKEMAMLERNDKGKQVRRYFIEVEKRYNQKQNIISFREQVECVGVVANILRVNDASKIMMLNDLYKTYDLPSSFLPKYENNGSRELKSATELLKRFDLGMSAKAFNILLIEQGYLEERTRRSTSSDSGKRKYKALTEQGLKYGENAVSPQCQREVQPLYYTDSFKELFDIVVCQEVA